MKYQTTILALAGLAAAREIPLYNHVVKREVPQEHSHQAIVATTQTNLQLNNPLKIQDAVFALLGNAAAAEGAPNVQNLDCLQQIVADQAFTNAKAAGDVDGQAQAILFRALERNTAAVGQASVLCNETATNPEIAAITQHQDPASTAASGNKQIALDVATQLSSIGADPTLAIQSGTFAPGKIGDPTAAGNTCDDANDPVGCIISQNLLVPDVSEAEIKSAVGNTASTQTSGTNTQASSGANAQASSGAACTPAQSSAGTNTQASTGSSAQASGGATAQTAAGTNVQAFTGTLGGAAPAVISSAADPTRPFSVNGATFVGEGAALQRSCAVQNNACANAANSGSIDSTVADCNAQEAQCNAAAAKKLRRAATATNVQTFTGTLGGAAPAVESSSGDRPFSVNGNTFVNAGAALQRSCAIQHNACASAANSGSGGISVAECGTQETACNAAASAKKLRKLRRAALDFGACSNPAISFGTQKDRPSEDAFAAVDQTDFNHGSALKIGVISGFVCQQLGNSKCGASAAAVSACNAASTAAQAQSGQASADTFNAALGVTA